MEEKPIRRDEQLPNAEGSVPYYEYSSVRQPAQPFIPLLSQPVLPQPSPPKRSLNRGLILFLAIGSIVLVVVLVFLSGIPQELFQVSH